jgi:hypothetical protein
MFSLFFIVSIDTTTAQQQQQTSQGAPLAIIPGLTGNILAIVSFLIGTSSFILGLRIQSAFRMASGGLTSSQRNPSASTLSAPVMHRYFELLILVLVIPSVLINTYGILLLGSHLYPEDAPYLLLLFLCLYLQARYFFGEKVTYTK